MELTESTQIEMHSGQIARIFQKNPGRFMTFGEKAAIRRDMANPPLCRSDFEKLSQSDRAQYCRDGGRIAG